MLVGLLGAGDATDVIAVPVAVRGKLYSLASRATSTREMDTSLTIEASAMATYLEVKGACNESAFRGNTRRVSLPPAHSALSLSLFTMAAWGAERRTS